MDPTAELLRMIVATSPISAVIGMLGMALIKVLSQYLSQTSESHRQIERRLSVIEAKLQIVPSVDLIDEARL